MLIHDSRPRPRAGATPEGFLRVRARIGRTGLHDYRAAEMGAPSGFAPDATIRVYRPPEEVFGQRHGLLRVQAGDRWSSGRHGGCAQLATLRGRPSGQEVVRDGDHLAADLLITDAAAVRRVEAGAELSNGYLADFDFTPGASPEGEPYDAMQSQHPRQPHRPRRSRTLRRELPDRRRAGRPIAAVEAALTTVTVDGVAFEVAATSSRRGAVAPDDRVSTATIAALAAQIPTSRPRRPRRRPRPRHASGRRATLGAAFEMQALSTEAIRRAVVARVLGADLGARCDDYVGAAFDAPLRGRYDRATPRCHLVAGAGARRDVRRRARPFPHPRLEGRHPKETADARRPD